MFNSPAVLIVQISLAMFCTATAFGVLFANMLVRGRMHVAGTEGRLHDVIFTERAYGIVSIIASLGALISFNFSWGTFAIFLSVAISLQIAEHWMLPRMREAAENSQSDIPYAATRLRFEVLLATCLMVAFWSIAIPPLATLARVYGLS